MDEIASELEISYDIRTADIDEKAIRHEASWDDGTFHCPPAANCRTILGFVSANVSKYEIK